MHNAYNDYTEKDKVDYQYKTLKANHFKQSAEEMEKSAFIEMCVIAFKSFVVALAFAMVMISILFFASKTKHQPWPANQISKTTE